VLECCRCWTNYSKGPIYSPSLKGGLRRGQGRQMRWESSLQLLWPGSSGLLKRLLSCFSGFVSGFDHSIWHLSCSCSLLASTRAARNTVSNAADQRVNLALRQARQRVAAR
jgi:hypothetical protein